MQFVGIVFAVRSNGGNKRFNCCLYHTQGDYGNGKRKRKQQ